jgi:molybdenum cofactor biosynthesis enzyme
MSKLSHIDKGNRPTMVDVSHKKASDRTAHARTVVEFPADVASRFSGGDIETAKGPVFATAIVAGVMAAKRTHELIPFCHPLGLDDCKITIELDDRKRRRDGGAHRCVCCGVDCLRHVQGAVARDYDQPDAPDLEDRRQRGLPR